MKQISAMAAVVLVVAALATGGGYWLGGQKAEGGKQST